MKKISKRPSLKNKSAREAAPAAQIGTQPAAHKSTQIGILLAILLVAATLRFVRLDQVPPGLHVDEAATAWNAYTLLNTGKDQHGVSWPIFYTRAFGGNPSMMYIYALIPFQAMGGLNAWTTRMPAAFAGVLTLLLIYFVGKRLFDPWIGLIAAAILSLNPWHLQTSRILAEATLVPFCVMISLAALLWSNLLRDGSSELHPNPVKSALAGALLRISCYGYWALRLFLPSFSIAVFLVTWPQWRQRLYSRKWVWSMSLLLIAGVITIGPLIWSHFNDPAIGGRARILGWLWNDTDTFVQRIAKVADRYIRHFGPDFLFASGDRDPALALPAGVGLFQWYDLPLMLIGLATVIRHFAKSNSARILGIWILVYPAGDIFSPHVSLHSLRSLPGLGALILLSALGAMSIGKWLWPRRKALLGVALGTAFSAAVLFCNIRSVHGFFGEAYHRRKVFDFSPELLDAARWLRPRLKDLDAVFITGQAIHPYIMTLVGLEYDPQQWFRDVKEIVSGPLPDGRHKFEDIYLRFGKIYFLYGASTVAALKELSQNGRPDHVVLILRPGELGLERYANPLREIRGPAGKQLLWIFEQNL